MGEEREKGIILLVDDEKDVLEMMAEFLKKSGYRVDAFSDSRKALFALKTNKYHVLIADLVMPGIDGLQLISFIQREYLDTLGILITGYGTLETAISALRCGVFDYILKPFRPEDVITTVESAMTYYHLLKNSIIPNGIKKRENLLKRFSEGKIVRENLLLKRCLWEKYRFENLIGTSFQMQKIFELIEKVADTNATVLITGESGTGKELIAKAIHYNSQREGPFVVVNCGAIPETLLESELFGHEKGAFTGALTTRPGRFEIANKGTIFLDEIGDMSLNLQVKILRVLQEKTFERVGGIKSITVDVRVIAATNKDLEKLVKEGKFREDLYYRLNVVPIYVPPLRERRQDIPLLLNHFLEKANRANNTQIEGFTDEALEILVNYDYPGNVRELQNLVERMVILKKKGYIGVSDLPEKLLVPKVELPPLDANKDYDTLVSEFEKALILNALSKSKGVKSKAAKILSINRTTLIEKMKRLGIKEV